MGVFYSIVGFLLIVSSFFIAEERAMFALVSGVVFTVGGTILTKIAEIEKRIK